jgi:hypothetical protein
MKQNNSAVGLGSTSSGVQLKLTKIGDEKEGTNGKLLFVLLDDVRRCCCLESQRRGNIIIGVWKD